ncbi:MAG: hypothetical protein V1847_01120 [Candidatus Diapherotrites archaeon]
MSYENVPEFWKKISGIKKPRKASRKAVITILFFIFAITALSIVSVNLAVFLGCFLALAGVAFHLLILGYIGAKYRYYPSWENTVGIVTKEKTGKKAVTEGIVSILLSFFFIFLICLLIIYYFYFL